MNLLQTILGDQPSPRSRGIRFDSLYCINAFVYTIDTPEKLKNVVEHTFHLFFKFNDLPMVIVDLAKGDCTVIAQGLEFVTDDLEFFIVDSKLKIIVPPPGVVSLDALSMIPLFIDELINNRELISSIMLKDMDMHRLTNDMQHRIGILDMIKSCIDGKHSPVTNYIYKFHASSVTRSPIISDETTHQEIE